MLKNHGSLGMFHAVTVGDVSSVRRFCRVDVDDVHPVL
jgi:hypothetical protein